MVRSVSRRFLLVLSESSQDHVLEDEGADCAHDVAGDDQQRNVLNPSVLHRLPEPRLVPAGSFLSKIAINSTLLTTNDQYILRCGQEK